MNAFTTTRVSVNSNGTQGNNFSSNPAISASGRFVAFDSGASNLVALGTNNSNNIFVHDLHTGTTTLVSVADDGTQGNNFSFNPAISGKGRFVAFESSASNLVANDTNNTTDIFVRDLKTGTNTLVSIADDGTQANNFSFQPTISGKGRFVAFESSASNLVASDTNNTTDIFVRDLKMGTTTLVSIADDGTQGNSFSSNPAISKNGRFVAFESSASNLVANDTNNTTDIFVRDLLMGTTTRVSVADDGTEGHNFSTNPAISASGRFVAFESFADNLVAGDTNNNTDIFVRDLMTGTTTRVSLADDDTEGNNDSSNPAISASGRFVAFESSAGNLVADDTNNNNGISPERDVFVRDLLKGTITRVSLASDGTQGNNSSTNPAISASGQFVAFQSIANNLVARDTNNREDIFVREINYYTYSYSCDASTVALGFNINGSNHNDLISTLGDDPLTGVDPTTLNQSNFA